MNNPDKYFRDKLYDLETPLNDRMSFEAVMARRKAGRKMLWWKPVLAIVAGLFMVSGAAYLWLGNNESRIIRSGSEVKVSGSATGSVNKNAPVYENNPGLNPSSEKPAVPEENALTSNNVTAGDNGRTGQNLRSRKNARIISPNAVSGSGSSDQNDRSVNRTESVSGENNIIRRPGLLAGLFGRGLNRSHFWNAPEQTSALNLKFDPLSYQKQEKLPFYVELMVGTGGNGYRNFNDDLDLTIRGNHHFSQYQGVVLADLGRGMLAGAGISYQAGMGVAQVKTAQYSERMVVDSHTVVIVQPGLPPRNVVIRDTSWSTDRVTKGLDISYRMNKISLPLAFRYHLGQGRGMVRLSATLAPGIVTMQAGTLFNARAMTPAEQLGKSALTFDARLGAGMYYQMSRSVALVAEPMLQLQAVAGRSWKPYNRLGAGFGLGVVMKL